MLALILLLPLAVAVPSRSDKTWLSFFRKPLPAWKQPFLSRYPAPTWHRPTQWWKPHPKRVDVIASGQPMTKKSMRGAWVPRASLDAAQRSARQLLQSGAPTSWNITEPLRVCTASIQDFGARCNGAPDPSLEEAVKPLGPVPAGHGWCPLGEDFCGYDVAVFKCAPTLELRISIALDHRRPVLPPLTVRRQTTCMLLICALMRPSMAAHACSRGRAACRSLRHLATGPQATHAPRRAMAQQVGLVEGRDYMHVCMGELGFKTMLDELSGGNRTLGRCDIGASAITATVEREEAGITFSRATHRSALAILTYAPLKKRGMWAFFQPLHINVWIALLGTILVTPFFVFFFESIFSGRRAPRCCHS